MHVKPVIYIISEFNTEDFIEEQNESTFLKLRKDDLILLSKHLRKRKIQKLVMEPLTHVTKSFEQSILNTHTQESKTTLELGSSPSVDEEKEEESKIDKETQQT